MPGGGGRNTTQEQQGHPRQQPRQQELRDQPGWRPWWSRCSTNCCGRGWGCQKTSQQEQIDHCTQAASWPTCASVASYLGAAETGSISAGAGADSGDCKPGLTSAQAPGAQTQGHCCGPAVCRVTAGSYCSQAQGSFHAQLGGKGCSPMAQQQQCQQQQCSPQLKEHMTLGRPQGMLDPPAGKAAPLPEGRPLGMLEPPGSMGCGAPGTGLGGCPGGAVAAAEVFCLRHPPRMEACPLHH